MFRNSARSVRGRVAGALLASSLAAPSLAAPSLADATPIASSGSEFQEITAAAEMYARDYGVSIAEASRRLDAQPLLSTVAADVRDAAGDRLGGVWIDQASFGVAVRLTPGSPVAEIEKMVQNVGTVKYDAPVSLATLEKHAQAVGYAWTARYPNIQLVKVDQRSSSIVVDAWGPAAIGEEMKKDLNSEFLADWRGNNQPDIRVEMQTDHRAVPANRGGRNLSNSCTSGFTGYGPASTGMTTAGHCSNSGGWKEFGSSTVQTMTYVTEKRDAYADIQFHSLPVMYNRFYGSSTTSSVVRSGRIGRGGLSGMYLCHRGQTTGYSCGTVLSVSEFWGGTRTPANSCGPTVPCAFTWISLEGASMHCQGGDSGGPVFTGGSAAGSLTACAGDHKGIFMATDYFPRMSGGFTFY